MKTSFTYEEVEQVYQGKAGHCCCGCAGKHTLNPMFFKEGDTYHGCAVSGRQLSSRIVKNVVNRLNSNPELIEKALDVCYSVTVGTRIYIVYLRETPTQITVKAIALVAAMQSATRTPEAMMAMDGFPTAAL